jgi:multiple sugar transport system ATP-binding protein
MGRALARQAQVYLFDEPLSNLDAKLRMEVRTQIKLLHQSLGMTSIFVTHDQIEAMTLADRIVCLNEGRIAQIGAPEELYGRPANVFVAGFIGSPQINLIPAELTAGRVMFDDGQSLDVAAQVGARTRVLVGLRPEYLTDETRRGSLLQPQPLTMEFVLSETLGSDTYLIGDLGGTRLTARCAPSASPAPGSRVPLLADSGRIHLFDPETGLRL